MEKKIEARDKSESIGKDKSLNNTRDRFRPYYSNAPARKFETDHGRSKSRGCSGARRRDGGKRRGENEALSLFTDATRFKCRRSGHVARNCTRDMIIHNGKRCCSCNQSGHLARD